MGDCKIREIMEKDFEEYIVLNNTNISKNYFNNFLVNILNDNHMIYVIENNKKFIGTGTYFIEFKLTHNGCKMGHIENIFIKKEERKKGYGKKLVKYLVKNLEEQGCYRIDLSCKKYLKHFYNLNDFVNNEITMTKLIDKNFK